MKTGKTLTELAHELERQSQVKRDFVADTTSLAFRAEENTIEMAVNGDTEKFDVSNHTHRQIGSRLAIPANYYDRMREDAPELLDANVAHWFQKEPETRMLRVLDGKARAFLSNRFRPLDNIDMAEAVLPQLIKAGADIASCEVTERRMYIKATVPGVVAEIPPAGKADFKWGRDHLPIDIISPGIEISNSEIGQGSVSIRPATWTVKCSNLATFKQDAMKKLHLGAAKGEGEVGVWEYLSDETKAKSDEALWMQIRDFASAALEGQVFQDLVQRLREARGHVIEHEPVKAVEIVAKKFQLTDGEGQGVLAHLLQGGDMSQYGLHSAITRHSQDIDDYDRATEMEHLGGQIIELAPRDWQELAKAA